MSKYFWITIAVIVAFAIYWLMDWHDHHPDGE